MSIDNIVKNELASAGINPNEIIHNDTFCQMYKNYKSKPQTDDTLASLVDRAEILWFGQQENGSY